MYGSNDVELEFVVHQVKLDMNIVQNRNIVTKTFSNTCFSCSAIDTTQKRSTMSPKRRIISSDTSDEEDSFKHRRTSLRVNLSYANLTDSGNGSLLKTETERNEEASHRLQASKELSRSKSKSTNENQSSHSDKGDNCVASEHATNDKDSAEEGVQLKDLRIYLEDINSKERALETKCRRLKDAILSKTKEAFDEEHELSIKITKVLRNEGANDIRANAENESVLVLNKTSDHFSSIFETPSNRHHIAMRKRHNSVDKSRLSQRQLFDREDRQGEGETKCRVIENVVLKNLPINIVRQSEPSSSPILSGSNKRLSLLRKRSTDRSGKLNNTYSTIHSVHSVDIEAPVVCSTFIEDNATSDDEEVHQNATDRANVDMSPAKHTINTVISMEMTKIHGNNRASERYESSQNRNPSTNEYIEEEVEEVEGNGSKRNKSASTRRPKDASRSRSTVRSNAESSDSHCTDEDEDEASVYVDSTVAPQLYGRKSVEEVVKKARETRKSGDKTETESEKRRTLSLSKSNETIRSSLNVNTSLDAPGGSAGKVEKSGKKSMVLDDQRESTSTVRTSLRVNTSTDYVRGPIRGSNDGSSLLQDRYDAEEVDDSNTDSRCSKAAEENTEANNVDYLENISLFERLRNVSERKQHSRENPTGKQVSAREEAKKDEAKNAGKSQNNMRASGDSCVEATPYPVSRSFLFKTLLKHKAQNAENSTSLCSNGTIENEKESDVMKSSAS